MSSGLVSIIDRLLSTIYHPTSAIQRLPSTVCRPPSTVHRLPSTAYHPPSAIHRLPSTVCHPPSAIHRLPSTAYRPPPLLCPIHRLPLTGCCRLSTILYLQYQSAIYLLYCLLSTICCLLPALHQKKGNLKYQFVNHDLHVFTKMYA